LSHDSRQQFYETSHSNSAEPGHVTLAEIKGILPIDSMTPEEIGQTMAQLEEAGIDIEVDKEFLRRLASLGIDKNLAKRRGEKDGSRGSYTNPREADVGDSWIIIPLWNIDFAFAITTELLNLARSCAASYSSAKCGGAPPQSAKLCSTAPMYLHTC